jgi:hypothetical protein
VALEQVVPVWVQVVVTISAGCCGKGWWWERKAQFAQEEQGEDAVAEVVMLVVPVVGAGGDTGEVGEEVGNGGLDVWGCHEGGLGHAGACLWIAEANPWRLLCP